MKQFIRKNITGRPLWVNILWALGLVLLLLLLFVLSMNWLTQHGVARQVPSVTGKPLAEAQKLLEDNGFDIVIQDSVYYDSLPPSAVIKQVPEADAVVKKSRRVYITVNRVIPPDVDMPNLRGYSLRNAEQLLRNLGLRIGDTTTRPDFAKGTVLEQTVNGNPVAPGSKIRVGSRIDLVVGSGVGAESLEVPSLVGMTYEQARALIESDGFILGSVVAPGVRDSLAAYVVRQSPDVRDGKGRAYRIRPGQMIDLWLDVSKPAPPHVDTAAAPPATAPADGGQ
ncbi:PASTA domain-containing protein [Flaviaesturariibacter flavus]|uniref:PASTA domain-containing protein n=1 Tax=Flaviaesturariibacter flavus TaxID=2502780 RepID=UPI001FB3E492|nr:PASTA domain-containing protein [Flaviaesturariibacter flavus]